MNIRLIFAAVVFTIIAGLAGTVYVQHLENNAKTAEIAQQTQALAMQKETISNLTAQAAEIARKHQELNAAYAEAEQRL